MGSGAANVLLHVLALDFNTHCDLQMLAYAILFCKLCLNDVQNKK